MKPNQITTILLVLATMLAACEQRPVDMAPASAEVEWDRVHVFEESASARVIWANGPTDVYVGYHFTPNGQTSPLLHYNGSTWASLDLPSSEPEIVRDLWGTGSGELYVSARSLWRWDGNSWSLMPAPAGYLSGTSAADVYVASDAHVVHFNGASWDTILVSPHFARSIYAFADPQVFVARNDSILIWNGSTWSGQPALGLINDMWGTSPNDLYAVGSDRYSAGDAEAWHWNGASWTSLAVPADLSWIDAVSGSGAGEVLATSEYFTSVLRLEGTEWVKLAVPTARGFSDIAFTASDEWIGVGHQDKVIRRSASTWLTLRDGGPKEVAVAWMDSPDFIVVAEAGYSNATRNAVYRLENGIWQEDSVPINNPSVIDGSSRTNIYLATWGGAVVHFDGSVWTSVIDTLVDQRDISVASDGGVFIVGQESSYRFDGTAWSRTYDGGRILQNVWARNRNEAYAISNDAVLHFVGGSWQLLHQDSHAFYQDVWGTNEGEVFIASMNGIYRYFEGTLERVSPRWSVESICGISSSDILAASQLSFFVFDGVVWNPAENQMPGYGSDLNSSPGGQIFMLRHATTDFSDRDELFVRVR